MSWIKKLFNRKNNIEDIEQFSEDEWERYYELKTEALESILGKMHSHVGHSVIPFEVGGSVDMYYFPNHLEGTGFATMELLNPNGQGPIPNNLGTYELVAFTKHKLNMSEEDNSFDQIEQAITHIFTQIGNYSFEAKLKPLDTIEVPVSEEDENLCLVLDLYEPEGRKFKITNQAHHLLLCLRIFRSEMDYAREHGGANLIELLKEKGCYPFSDLNREAVV